MNGTPLFEIGGLSITVYALLMVIGYAASVGLAAHLGKKKGLKAAGMCLYGVLAALIGLCIGRAIYTGVLWDWIYLDELGEFVGIGPFFDVTNGSINVIGPLCGVLLAAPLAAKLMKERAAAYLDAAAVPALLLFLFARAIEPLSGQGYGDLLMNEALCFFPLALVNDMGDYSLSVCFIEACLTALVIVCVCLLQKKVKRSGTLAQYALVLLCLSQILPESLRRDNVLYVFIFARVTHLGLAFALGLTLIRLLVQGAKQGLDKKSIVWDSLGLAVGIGLCIATIFALDKTNLPKLLVYAVMVLSLVELGFVICRRIHLEDKRVVKKEAVC